VEGVTDYLNGRTDKDMRCNLAKSSAPSFSMAPTNSPSFVVTIPRTTPFSPRSNCQMFATPRTNFSGVTIAPHENQN
jgi:hypothetical protein